MKLITCLLRGHEWRAVVWGDHVSLRCKRCDQISSAEFDGEQPYVLGTVAATKLIGVLAIAGVLRRDGMMFTEGALRELAEGAKQLKYDKGRLLFVGRG